MENKYVGFILLGVSVLILLNILVFNSMLGDLGNDSCAADNCPYHRSFNNLIYLSYGIVGILFIVGFVLIFSKPQKEIIIKTKTIHKKTPKKIINTSGFKPEEKQVLELIQKSKAIFQAELIERTGFGKAKMTRIIDRLEGQGIVERKRRGMTNVVVMKE